MMGRWLALLSTAALIIAAAAIDPCKRQPFRGRCPSIGNQPPKRSQFVLRYYARNGECVSYPYGHCASDESEPQLYRYKEECEDSCINNTPQNLGAPKSPEENQTYGTVTPLKESPTVSLQREPSPKSEEKVTTKSTTVTSPPTTESTTTETDTTTEKATTEEPTTEAPTTEAPVTTTAPTSSSTEHVTTQSVSETTEEEIEEEEEEEEENSVNNEEKVQESSSTQSTTKVPTTSPARTECERRREAASSSKIRGGFVPVCDSNGNFQKVQCEPDGRQCFCVNTNGIEISNSRTRNGAHPDCAKIETAVSPRTQSCTGQAERGPCSSSYTRFYYDEATSKCNTFSYSGCGGNGNSFETESECTRRCVPSKPTVAQPQSTAAPARTTNDLCSLPKERGPCDKYELRFYYNADTKECKYFFWGGCEGNGNNFETAEACQSACGVGKATQHNIPRTFAHSSGPIKTIPGVRIGNGSVSSVTGEEIVEVTARPTTVQSIATQPTTRFVPQTVPPTTRGVPITQQTTQRTHAPTTTGAPPSPSTSAPVPPTPARPSTPVVVLPGDIEDANRCAHPLDSGSCRGQFVRWFWDSKRNACDVFTYSGCEGNGNNFASREECLAICHKRAEPAPVPPQPDFSNVCKHDIDSGECTGVFQRFAFDTEKGECRPFTYGGCGGNGNNFATMPECQAKCERTEESPVNVCEFEIEAGECTGVFPRFAYDHESNDCRPFTYGGCGGNGNNFASINECRNVCVKKSCLPVSQCDLSHCQIVNDNRGCPFCSCAPPKLPIPSPQCPPLDASRCLEPCIVISNRRGCQECACPHLQSTVVPPVPIEPRPPGTNQQTARPPATPERVAPPAPQSNRIIATIPGVQEVLKSPLPPGVTDDIQDKCLQPMETGPCKQFVDRWFFNKEDGSCHPFKYGGCAGNRNHFFTQRECEIHCSRFLREVSEEISGEKDEFEVPLPPRKAAGVSSVHVLEPLPVENYKSPEPPLRGAYGKKNYLEPATTQGVKIVTSTARPSTTTTTPTTTRTTTTASTTVKIEENVDAEEEEEEEPEEITTTAVPLTTEVVAEAPKKTVKEELERLTSEVGKDVREEQAEEEEEEVEEETIEAITTASVPTSRASRLLETATEAAEEEEEEIEEKEEASGNVETTPVKAPEAPLPVVEAIEKALELQTAKPEVETTLMNEINSMEGEEGVEENEITPSSMMSSSKFAVHRQTEEAHRFEEVTPDLKQNPVENKEELHGTILKKVEITRPPTTTAPPTTEAPSTEAATQAESSTPSTTKVAESTTSAGTIQSSVQNVQITESTSTASRSVSTEAPTTPTTTQARPTTTIDKDEEPTFDPNAIKKEINEPRASGVAQVTVEPTNGIGRQPVPLGSELNLPEMDPKDIEDLEEPTTIFPTTKSASVRPTTPNAQQGPTAQTTRGFDSHDPKIICAMPADAGYCEKYEARWFFNSQTGQCDQFSYGGCAGNMNNFVNRTLCELSCMASHPGLASQVPERCSYDKDAGFGKGYNVKWYFNMRNLRCEQFVYEGKGGNSNQFETLSDCERFCSPQPTRPTQATRPTLATIVPTHAATTRTPTAAPRVEATQSTAVPMRAAATNSPLVPLPTAPKQPIIDDNDAEYEVDAEDETDATLAPPLATRGPIPPAPTNILPSLPVNPPGTEPKPPAFGSLTNVQSAIKAVNVNEATHTSSAPKATAAPVASTQSPESATYKAEAIKPHNLGIDQSNLKPTEKIVAPSPKETVNYQTGQSAKVQGLANFNDGRLPPPDTDDIKNLDEKTIRPSCPNGNKELRYTDGRPVMCLPGHKQCPDKSVCYFNGMDYFCCPNEDDPYDRHVFGGYGGDEARNGYKVFGPLRIRRLMDEVPLRAKRQTSIDKAFNTNPVSFNLDSVVAPLRFDSDKPRHVSRASMMRKPNPPKHGNPMCILPLVKGDCSAAHLRYYYDRTSDSCRLFYYSGCQGNANNFGSLEDCQRLCVLGGQIAPAVQGDAVTPATIIAPGQCPTGSPLGGSLPVLCGNSTESIGCPTGYYCRGGPPDICCPGVDPALKNVQHGVKTLPETTPVPGVPRNYYKEQLISTPLYMCPDASDPLMGENGVPAVCGAGFDGVKMCPKGYYCAIDGAKGSRLCCPLFGSSASKIPTESVYAPTLSRRNPNPGEVIDRGSLPSDQAKYDRNERIELPTPTTAAPTTTEAPEEEEEYEDDEDPQKLRIKGDNRNQAMQEDAASNSSKAVDISQEPVNIDVPKEEEPAEEPAQPTDTPVKPVFDKSICQLKPTEGRACREDEKAPKTNLHYFYSAKDRRCKLYFYRGCGGSANRFEKKADCEALCLNA